MKTKLTKWRFSRYYSAQDRYTHYDASKALTLAVIFRNRSSFQSITINDNLVLAPNSQVELWQPSENTFDTTVYKFAIPGTEQSPGILEVLALEQIEVK